jgi:hypothetical protein
MVTKKKVGHSTELRVARGKLSNKSGMIYAAFKVLQADEMGIILGKLASLYNSKLREDAQLKKAYSGEQADAVKEKTKSKVSSGISFKSKKSKNNISK